MTQTQICTKDNVKNELGVPSSTDDTLISHYIDVACNAMEHELRLTFGATTFTQTVIRPPNVRWDRDGVVRIRLGIPNITAITALDIRIGTPADAWQAVPTTYIDIPTGDHDTWISTYMVGWSTALPLWTPHQAGLSLNAPLAARVSGTAGYSAGAFPPDLVQIATVWAAYLYRSKDVPHEKTANPMMGTVTIPSAFPVKIARMLDRWREWTI